MNQARRDFGSFHSSNVQELVQVPENEYQPPTLPFGADLFKNYPSAAPAFGTEMKKKHFLLQDDCVFLNHGAFGGVLKDALETAQQYQLWTERQPLRFFDRELLPRLVHVTRRLAKFVGCDPGDVVLVENVTTALNSVIRSISLTPEDSVFCLSVTYGAVKKMLKQACDVSGAKLVEATVEFPVKDQQQLITCVRDSMPAGAKYAVFDHIPSNTPFIMPLKEIIQVCKERHVRVIIDGAHALGSLPLDISSLDPDYYITNCHKWFCCPKGTALMYVRKELQSQTRPVIISHGFGSGFNSEFIWAGLHDYSPYLAIHTVLDFWQALGPDRIRSYMHDLCRTASRMLADSWGTTLAAPESMFGSMGLVELPRSVYEQETVNYSNAENIQNLLYHNYNIEVPIKCVQGRLYVRISAHIYNVMSEYEMLRDAILDIAKNI